jgi:hypothetical protein
VLAVAQQDVRQRPVRHEEPAPVDRRQPVLERADVPLAAERTLEPRRRAGPEADRPVAADRVVHLEAPQQRVGIVVGHVEVGEVGPHLQRVDARVAQRRAGLGERERGGGLPGEGRHDRRPELQPVPDERGDDTDRHRAPREPAEDASASQGGRSILAKAAPVD